jgi:hypothetical protein
LLAWNAVASEAGIDATSPLIAVKAIIGVTFARRAWEKSLPGGAFPVEWDDRTAVRQQRSGA